MSNGKLDITLVDIDGDGRPDEVRLSFRIGTAAIVGIIAAVSGYLVI
jgi:hypothetical protein